MTTQNSKSVYSNAFNFHDFITGGVDPRTGIYTSSLTMGEIKSGDLNGPSFPVNVYFNPLHSADTGMGVGWSLALTRYDAALKTLTLSSGESYKAKVSAKELVFDEFKLETIKVSRPTPKQYHVVHKEGLREELEIYGRSDIAVPVRMVAPNGAAITFNYTAIDGQPILQQVRDSKHILLSIARTSGAVTLTQYPGTVCEAKFILRLINSSVVSIDMPTGGSWKLVYESYAGRSYLKQVDSPLGARELIGYQEAGHRFPRGGPSGSIPQVNSHTVFPRHTQPAITTTYEFTDNNFLGYNAEAIRWSEEGDNLYQAAGDYRYASTERLMLEGKVHSSTVRTYNKYHLQVSQVTTCKKMITSQFIDYHLDPRKSFSQQPAQFRLPKAQTVRYENRETGKSRDEVVRTEFDAGGNLLKQIDANGVTTVSEFYPAGGADGCPADPLGFVRFEKQRTVTPAPAVTTDKATLAAAPTVTRYRYKLLRGIDGATVQFVVPVQEKLLELTGKTETLRSLTDLVHFDEPANALRHGLLQKQTVTTNDKSTEAEFLYTLSDTTCTVQTTQIGFDGARRQAESSYSALNGLKLAETNEDDGTVVFEYDAIGRLLSETVSAGTGFSAKRHNVYELAVGSTTPATLLSTDVNGLQQRITYDGLGRTIRVDEQDADYQTNGPLRTVYSAQHNAVGQLIEETRSDWVQDAPLALKSGFVFDDLLKGAPLALKSGFDFDDWGQVKTTRHADGRIEHTQFDPVTLRETHWQEGMGKTVSIHNLFGKPQSVEVFDIKEKSLGKTLHEYDGLGRGVSQTDPVGNKTLFQYDVFNRLQRSTLPDGHTVETEYAAHSQGQLPVEVKIAGRSLGQQTFDGLGRLTQSKTGGRVTTAGFEAGRSKPAWEQAPGGDRVNYQYEPHLGGLVTQRTTTGLLASYTYHPKLGLPTLCTEGGRESSFEYYPSGRLKRETSTSGTHQEKALYTYSLGGRPLTCTDVLGHQHTTAYDEQGRPKSFAQNTLKAGFAYNALGQLQTVTAQDTAGLGSLVTQLAYDDLGREVSRRFEVRGAGTQTLTSSYTLASKLARKTLKSGTSVLRDEHFTYDKRGRLDQYTCAGTQRPRDPYGKEIIKQTYVFDAMDNIVTLETEFPGGKNLTSYDHSALDPTQLIGIRHSHKDYPPPAALQYDANGQLIVDEQARRLTYDALGRLTQVANAVGGVLRGYHYDARDHLVELSQPVGPPTQRYYREGRVINEACGPDKSTCLRSAGILLGQHQQRGQGAETRLVGTDQQQSVLTEVWGAKRQDFAYSPYGYRPAEGGLFSLQGFSNEQLDPLTGLYLLGNGYRAYSPTLMRFLSPDSMSPFGAGGLNPYAYCGGDPINRVDPTGHFWKALLGIVAAVAGFALSVVTFGAATPLAVLGLVLAGVSATLGVAGIIVDEVAPESGVGKILGWASLATGLASAGAGLAAVGKSAAQWGSKLAGAFKSGLSGRGGAAAGREMARGLSRAGSSGQRTARAVVSNADDIGLRGNGPTKIKLPHARDIKEGLTPGAQFEYDTFKNAIHNEGLDAVRASQRMGDPKLKLLNRQTRQFEVRISGGDRVTFINHAQTSTTGPYVEILQVGGHT